MNKNLLLLKDRQDEIFLAMANILAGLSSPVRIKVLHFLSQGPITVETLASKIGQSVANTSMHLRKMLAEKIVHVSVQGQKRVYSIHPAALDFWETCQNFVQKVDPTLTITKDDEGQDINWGEDLKTTVKMAKDKELVLLDVRPSDEISDHLPELNVVSIPGSEISRHMSKIPKRKPVVVFCRGRLCALSLHVVNELREMGFKAYRLDESWYALKKAMNKKGDHL